MRFLNFFVDKISYSRFFLPRLYATDVTVTKTDSQGEEDIVIPCRIQRGPTDVLKALASTVSKDFTAPHYKYQDDPYFIPSSNIAKRSFALSKESGRKAARYFLEKYPQFFKCNKSEPEIKAFEPPLVIKETDDVTEDILNECVRAFDVTNSITTYEILSKKGVKLNQETKQNLLELLCFYNSTQPPHEHLEDRWYSLQDMKRKNVSSKWINNGMAGKVFQDMEKTSAAYCAMIQGTAKHFQIKMALELYEEMQSKNMPGTTEMYNSLLSLVPYMKEDPDIRWDVAMDFVKNMNTDGLRPDLYTMNALLEIASLNRKWEKKKQIAPAILTEMKNLSIEPSLATYLHLLNTFCRERGYSCVMTQVLDLISEKEFTIQHHDDILFFYNAMEICNKHIGNKELAYRLHSILESGRNYMFVGLAFFESLYFRNFFQLLCHTEDFEKLMEIYEKYVPNTYTPEPLITLEVIRALDISGAYHYLPKICSDIALFEHSEREEILSEVLRIAGSMKYEDEIQDALMSIIWCIIEKLNLRTERNICRLQWTGSLLGDALKVYLNGRDLEKAWILMQKMKNEESAIMGYPESEYFVEFCKIFLEAKEFDKVKSCVSFVTSTCYPKFQEIIEPVINELFKNNVLNENDRPVIDDILGKGNFEDVSDESLKSENACRDV